MLKKIKIYLNKWKYISCSCIRRHDVLTVSVFLMLIHKLISITLIITVGLSVELDKVIRKFIWKGTIIEKVNLKDTVEELDLPGNKIYLVAIIILWYRCKEKQIDHWYRINRKKPTHIWKYNLW